MIAIGIDPGKSGALVCIRSDHGEAPEVLHEVTFDELGSGWWVPPVMTDLFRGLPRPDRVALEAPQAARTPTGMGHGTLGIGIRWGYLHALSCLSWPGADILTPAASTWTSILRDQPGEGKARSIALVSSRLPGLHLVWGRRRVPHDGLADAGALALWALARRPAA